VSAVSYETVSMAVQQGGAVYFVLMFAAAVAYAAWPKNRAKFHRAARAPLEEEE
jgi:cytochrome c oxidase cbb3-type subunit 4